MSSEKIKGIITLYKTGFFIHRSKQKQIYTVIIK